MGFWKNKIKLSLLGLSLKTLRTISCWSIKSWSPFVVLAPFLQQESSSKIALFELNYSFVKLNLWEVKYFSTNLVSYESSLRYTFLNVRTIFLMLSVAFFPAFAGPFFPIRLLPFFIGASFTLSGDTSSLSTSSVMTVRISV